MINGGDVTINNQKDMSVLSSMEASKFFFHNNKKSTLANADEQGFRAKRET
eukprot:CAMPEP_0176342790 /NCGR_PEP_ID=MMETSP0126-20121128/3455_1 /TAXON_ID=141414 ORGANISM="Strombidinopsis acuminatum, Strain SPMC142" /NCGR_SAMPLE_ID=MMETSP0126 /ASSEMBLY_ACC=CAM_ASM_000229 /LENGTH=50 /DNA_ID=CAMNT_0017688409 /DNA_START=836 /DNA_END=988 /DNA_ORIENTATION=+